MAEACLPWRRANLLLRSEKSFLNFSHSPIVQGFQTWLASKFPWSASSSWHPWRAIRFHRLIPNKHYQIPNTCKQISNGCYQKPWHPWRAIRSSELKDTLWTELFHLYQFSQLNFSSSPSSFSSPFFLRRREAPLKMLQPLFGQTSKYQIHITKYKIHASKYQIDATKIQMNTPMYQIHPPK